jgi:ABC-type multidrug transport system ATPase subunit
LQTLKLNNLHKSFGKKTVLQSVSLTVSQGEILALYGRNGCGKSTLLKILFGTLKANPIDLLINGKPTTPNKARLNQIIAYIPHHPFLPSSQKVRDIIPMYHDSQEQQDAVFYDPYIASFTARKVSELSLGQRRYFEVILLANSSHPFILIDEPFSMIEPLHKERLKEFLSILKRTKGIILTDHYYNDVLEVSTKNIILKDGLVQTINTKEDLLKHDYLRSV